MSARNPSLSPLAGQGDGGPFGVRTDLDRPDVAEFAGLVRSIEGRDFQAARRHTSALRSFGWSICPIGPKAAGGRS